MGAKGVDADAAKRTTERLYEDRDRQRSLMQLRKRVRPPEGGSGCSSSTRIRCVWMCVNPPYTSNQVPYAVLSSRTPSARPHSLAMIITRQLCGMCTVCQNTP